MKYWSELITVNRCGAKVTKYLDMLYNDDLFFTDEDGSGVGGENKLMMNIYANHQLEIWCRVGTFEKLWKQNMVHYSSRFTSDSTTTENL